MGSQTAAVLDAYRKKRDFSLTAEPTGSKASTGGSELRYVIQKHDARNLHYDLRLEWDGVLKSWAVPKGPSENPSDKRLAVMVEDHPLDYADFEGNIPKGQYGAGTVIVWDYGTWEAVGKISPVKALEKGHLKFRIHGEKLKGIWTLARMNSSNGDNNWLLIKHKDKWSASGDGQPVTERAPESVKSGREIEMVEDEEPAGPAEIKGAKRRKVPPRDMSPELATLTERVPEGEAWLHEIKLDGYRMLACKQGKKVTLTSRNGKDWTDRFGEVTEALQDIAGDALLDGEVVVMDGRGISSFQALQRWLEDQKAGTLAYWAFDLPWADGQDLRNAPLIERKQALRQLLQRSGLGTGGTVRYCDHIAGRGREFHQQACANGLEGIISKKASSHYRGKRTREWLKVKCTRSTWGARRRISSPSAWATQPATASSIPPPCSARSCLKARSRPSSENTFSAAFSRMWQVLRITMSAPRGLSTAS